MTLYEKDVEGKLIKASEVPEEAIRIIESMDDAAIVQRMTTGIAGDAFIYRYPIQTKAGVKEIIGISTDGAYELARSTRNLETLPDFQIDKDSDPDYIYATIRVRNIAENVTLLGVGRQCKFMVDKGNNPIRDRKNEHAFVAAISKAQRNGILHHIKQDVLAVIIDTWQKTGKSKQLRPTPLQTESEPKSTAPPAPKAALAAPKPAVVTPPPAVKPETAVLAAPTEGAVAEQVEKIKKLRMEVHNKFQADLGIGLEKRKTMLKEKFSVDALTDLSEQQLKECKAWIEEMIDERTQPQTSKPVAVPETKVTQVVELGFESADEQVRLRGTLYSMLTDSNQLGLKPDEARKFIADKGFTSANDVPKGRILEMIKEVEGLIEIKQLPPPSEDKPGTDEVLF